MWKGGSRRWICIPLLNSCSIGFEGSALLSHFGAVRAEDMSSASTLLFAVSRLFSPPIPAAESLSDGIEQWVYRVVKGDRDNEHILRGELRERRERVF